MNLPPVFAAPPRADARARGHLSDKKMKSISNKNLTDNPSFTGMNKNLLAEFHALRRSADGKAWEVNNKVAKISAPVTQASMELAMTWQSPFEGAGVESRFPELAQMAQAGMFAPLLHAIGGKLEASADEKEAKSIRDRWSSWAAASNQLVGKTGVTKLNSTQVFSGMPPVKVQLSVLFRAFRDPLTEVEEPLRRLQEWALPQYLAPDGVLSELIKNTSVVALMPSDVPLCVSLTYKGRQFRPMVIENITDPLDAPIDENGRRVSAVVQLTLCSLTALDRNDWGGTYKWRNASLG